MSAGVFRDHKSSNRIELYLDLFKTYCISSDLVPGSGARGLGGWMCGCVWVPPTCVHTHTCMHMCMCNAENYMLRNCKWLLTWRYPCLLCSTYVCLCTCMCISACACMCVCVWGFPHPPKHPQRGPHISKISISLELIEVIQFYFKNWNLWKLPSLWVVGWMEGLMGGVMSNY